MNGSETSAVALAIVFIVAAVVVSFDVAGLTISKAQELRVGGRTEQRNWALLNAIWHAALLLSYCIAIHISLDFIDIHLLDWIRGAFDRAMAFLASFRFNVPLRPEYVARVVELIKEHVRIILGAVTLVVVWVVYDNKIVGTPRRGTPGQLSGLAVSLYGMLVLLARLRHRRLGEVEFVKTRKILFDNLQAALVAVDMLALAALLKALHYLEDWAEISAIVLTVLLIVFVLASVAARFASQLPTDAPSATAADPLLSSSADWLKSRWLMITMRLVEPLLIFYFALELVAWVVFRERIHSVGFFLGALALVGGLLAKHGLGVISVRATEAPSADPEADARFDDEIARITVWSTLWPLLKLALWVVAGAIGGTLALAVVGQIYFPHAGADVQSLDGLVTRLAIVGVSVVAFASVTALMFQHRMWLELEWPWIARFVRPFVHCCDWIEDRAFRLLSGCMNSKWTLLCCIIALVVAALVPIYEQVADTAYKVVGGMSTAESASVTLKSNHYHGLQIAAWLAMAAIFAWLMAMLDHRRNVVREVEARMKEASLLRADWQRRARENRCGYFFSLGEAIDRSTKFKQFVVVEVACVLLLASLPYLARWHDGVEIAGFRVAEFEETERAIDIYSNAVLSLRPGSLQGADAIQQVNAVMVTSEIYKRLPRSCRHKGVPVDAWKQPLSVRVHRVDESIAVTIGSSGRAPADATDDVARTVTISVHPQSGNRTGQ